MQVNMALLACLLVFLALQTVEANLLKRDPTYVVVAPSTVRPNQDYKVSATILKMEYSSFTVTAIIRKLNETKHYVELASGQTTFTREGTAEITIKTLDNLRPGNYTLRVGGYSDTELRGQIFTNDTELFFEQKQISVLIQLSKPFYRQGQTVRLRVVPIETNLLSVSTTMDISILDVNGYTVRKWVSQHTNAGGVVSLSYPLNHNLLAYGDWTVQVDCKHHLYNKTFRVEEFYAPLFYVNISMPTYMLSSSYGLSGLIASNHTTGRGTKGNAYVILQIQSLDGQDSRVIDPIRRDIAFFDGRADFLFTRQEMELKAGGPSSLDGKELKVTGYVTDWFYNMTASGYQSAIVYNTDIMLNFLGGNVWSFKPNLPFPIYIAASNRDGSPLDPFNPNRTINLEIQTDSATASTQKTEAYISRDTSIAEFWVHPGPQTSRIHIIARYLNQLDSRRYFTASRYWSPNNYYLQLSTPTKRPTVGQYMTFTVKTNAFIEKIHYYITSTQGIIVSDTLSMYSRSKLFSVALSRDMAPSSRIIAYFIAPDNQVITDSLNFHVNGTGLHEMSVKFNRGKDFSYKTIEITARADPLSYVAFSAIEYQLYALGARNGFTWEEVYEELYSYDTIANKSIRHYWHQDGQISGSFYAPTPTFANDANNTFFYAGLYIFTDANSSAVYTHCNKTEGWMPCSDGLSCYAATDMCNWQNKCARDARDEMGCQGNATYELTLNDDDRLWRTKHIGAFFQDGGFMWQDQFTKPDGRIDIRVNVPTYPTTWAVSGFSMSKDNGLAILSQPELFDGVRPMYISVQGPKIVKRGEQIALRVSLFNFWTEEMDILISVPPSNDYSFVQIDREKQGSFSQMPELITGTHQILIPVFPGSNRQIYLPIVTRKNGHIAIPIQAACVVGGHTVTHHVYVEFEGVQENWITNYQFNLLQANAKESDNFKIITQENLYDQDESLANYISESPKTTLYIQGDVIGTTFSDMNSYDLDSQKTLNKPYGTGAEMLYNFGINIYVLKMLRELSTFTQEKTVKVIYTLNVLMQEMLFYLESDGSFKEFRWSQESSTWVTATALGVLAEGAQGLDDLNNDFAIPPEALRKMGDFLTGQQRVDGAFEEINYMYNYRFQSTFDVNYTNATSGVVYTWPSNMALTALTMISLTRASGQLSSTSGALARGDAYLRSNWRNIPAHHPFELAIVTYCMMLRSIDGRASALDQLMRMKRESSGLQYWSDQHIAANVPRADTPDADSWLYPKQLTNSTAYAVATTSYAVMSILQNGGDLEDVEPYQAFLQGQHEWIGGFASTQESLLAFQVLKVIATKDQDRPSYELAMTFNSDQDKNWKPTIYLRQDNWFDLHVLEAPSHWGVIQANVSGYGRALFQMQTLSNHEYREQLRKPVPGNVFDLGELNSAIRTSGFNHSFIDYHICPTWRGSWKDHTGMAVLEITIPSGYVVVNKTLQAFVRSQLDLTSLRNAEFLGNKAVFYFAYLNRTKENCADFRATRWHPVANITEQHAIKVYEYYEPGLFNYTFYEKTEVDQLSLCLVCGSYQCPYCPHYASGSLITPSLTITIIALLVSALRLASSQNILPAI